jgi:hypothetical protein
MQYFEVQFCQFPICMMKCINIHDTCDMGTISANLLLHAVCLVINFWIQMLHWWNGLYFASKLVCGCFMLPVNNIRINICQLIWRYTCNRPALACDGRPGSNRLFIDCVILYILTLVLRANLTPPKRCYFNTYVLTPQTVLI